MGIKDGFVILTSGSDTLYEELYLEEHMQLADIVPVTLLVAGLAHNSTKPYYEIMDLPDNSDIIKMEISDLLSLGFEQEYLNLVKFFQPVIWQIENGMIQKQYLNYAVGHYDDINAFFTSSDTFFSPLEPDKRLQDLILVRSDTQDKVIVQMTGTTLLINWSMESPLSQLKTIFDSLKDKVQIILVLQVTDTKSRYPILMNALNTRADTLEKIERRYIDVMEFETARDLQYIQDLILTYPELLIYEDQSYEMVRWLNLLPLLNPKLVESDDRSVMVYMFYLIDEKGLFVKELLCRLTLGDKEDTVLVLNILEKAIDKIELP